jgi:CIC family chloride channel protein
VHFGQCHRRGSAASRHWFPTLAEQPTAFAVVGMAAFFTAVVRAPVTGIVLVTEMTGDFTLLLPMLLAVSRPWQCQL